MTDQLGGEGRGEMVRGPEVISVGDGQMSSWGRGGGFVGRRVCVRGPGETRGETKWSGLLEIEQFDIHGFGL